MCIQAVQAENCEALPRVRIKMNLKINKKPHYGDTWVALLVECMTLDLRVMVQALHWAQCWVWSLFKEKKKKKKKIHMYSYASKVIIVNLLLFPN